MYKLIFESREQLIDKVEEQLDKAQSDFDSMLGLLPDSNEYDKNFIKQRIHHLFEFFSEFTLDQNDGRTHHFMHLSAISDFDQRYIALPMLNAMMQFAQSILLQPTDNKDEYLHRYSYYYNILEYLNIVAKLLLCKQYVIEFNNYHIPISLAILQHNENMGLLQDNIYFSYIEKRRESLKK